MPNSVVSTTPVAPRLSSSLNTNTTSLPPALMGSGKYRHFPTVVLFLAIVVVLGIKLDSLDFIYHVEDKNSTGIGTSTLIGDDGLKERNQEGKKIDSSQNEGTTTPCWRKCPKGRRNKIVYLHNKPDGLSDRLYIFSSLSNLAGYLCATVVAPKPFEMLSTWHNYNNHSQNNQHQNNPDRDHHWDNGEPISPQLQWIDFLNLTFQQDHTSSMQELPVPTRFQAQQHYMFHSDYNNFTKFITEKPRDVISHWREAEKYSWEQQESNTGDLGDGFLWIIQVDWYMMDIIFNRQYNSLRNNENNNNNNNANANSGKGQRHRNTAISSKSRARAKMLPYPVTASQDMVCNYLEPNTIPTPMVRLIDRIWQHIITTRSDSSTTTRSKSSSSSIPSPIVGMFHIRRTDGRSECNTSLQRMKSYISCSFQTSPLLLDATKNQKKSKQKNKKPSSELTLTVLLATDEKDIEYRQAIISMLQEQSTAVIGTTRHSLTVDVVDLDALVTFHIQQAIDVTGDLQPWFAKNNYYVYRIEQVIQTTYVSFHLQQRRSFQCNDCDPIQIHR